MYCFENIGNYGTCIVESNKCTLKLPKWMQKEKDNTEPPDPMWNDQEILQEVLTAWNEDPEDGCIKLIGKTGIR